MTRNSRLGTRQLPGLLGLAVLLSCAGSVEPTGDIEIRIANESSFAFESVDVVFPVDSVDYGPVPSHGLSEYRRVEQAYSYALIIVQVGGEELRLQPIDYVGTPLLEAGRYTYALNLTIEGQLTLATRNDMSNTKSSASNSAWDAIENEKKRDRFIRRICTVAWGATGVFVLLLAFLVGTQVWSLAKGAIAGQIPWMSVAGVAMPLIGVLGMLSVLVATVSTIGVFIRMRTSSLHEIQLRLATLEDMLASGGGTTA